MDEEQRLVRIERYLDALKYHLFVQNQLLLELARDYADVKCENPEENILCQKITREIESLKTLRNLANRK